MPYEFLESDWKVYRSRTEAWRERYLARKNAEIAAFLQDESLTPTNRFWDAQEKIDEEAKILVKCFDPHARSRIQMALLAMLHHGLIEEPDLEGFSDGLVAWLRSTSKVLNE